MIATKTTALIATMSLLGAITPAAFAQNFNVGDIDSSLDANIEKQVSQSIDMSATNEGDGDINQKASQGFCEQIAISQATGGLLASTDTTQEDVGAVDISESQFQDSEVTGKDCS
jgi:hypothetical protein